MEKAVITTDMGKSLVIPPVTVRIPMPQGAGTPAPSQTPKAGSITNQSFEIAPETP